jgi:hypothetical protein
VSKPSNHKFLMPAVWVSAIAIAAVTMLAGSSHLRAEHVSAAKPFTTNAPAPADNAGQIGRVRANMTALPLAFEANEGQMDPQVKYMARGNGYKLFLTSSQAILKLSSKGGRRGNSEALDMMMNKRRGAAGTRAWIKKQHGTAQASSPMATVRMNLLGPGAKAQLSAQDLQQAKVNYFVGRDRSKWRSNVPLYGRVSYKDVYPGVDVAFHGAAQSLEFDYLVSPGADPTPIAVNFEGVDQMQANEAGDLVLSTSAGPVELHKPVAYQVKDGVRKDVDARFVIRGRDQIAFAVGAYDHSRELVIDPTVFYSTYFGGNFADYGFAIAVDANGNSYIGGATDSDTIPGPGGPVTATSGPFEAFVTKIDTNGALVFTSIFGGTSDEYPGGIAVDSQGIYVAGITTSPDFPVTVGAPQTTFQGGATSGNNDAFAVALSLDGTVINWGTYVGGNDSDSALGVAVDASHNVYVVGETFSTNLPVTAPPLPDGSALNITGAPGNDDGYIAVISAAGTAYNLVSYIGGSSGDLATGVSLDPTGNIYVVGETISVDLPFTTGVVQPACGTDGTCNSAGAGAQDDAFIYSIKADHTGYNYVTYFGGSSVDDAFAVAADASGNVFLTGMTTSTDFLISGGGGTPYQSTLFGAQNAFILELNSSGSAVNYQTYFGGEGSDSGLSIALDSADNIYITGATSSPLRFPLLNPTQGTLNGNSDAFVSVFGLGQDLLLFSTYLGGGGDEDQLSGAIGLDAAQNIYVTGDTDSGNGSTSAFPTTTGAIGTTYGGGTCVINGSNIPCPDAFVTSYTPATAKDFTISATALSPAAVNPGSSATSTITITPLNNYAGTVTLSCTITGGGAPLPACSSSGSTLTVTTTGAAAAALHRSSGILFAMWLPVLGLSLIGMRFSAGDSRRRKLMGFLLLGIVMAMLFFLPACGGSSGGGGGGGGGGGCTGCTPAGNYTISVTGTDSANNLSHTAIPDPTLTVN